MRKLIGISMAAIFGAAGTVAFAQAPESPPSSILKQTTVPHIPKKEEADLQTRRAVLFQRILEKPDDLDAAFEYASLSVQVGDIEAAISTLERMLVFAPGQSRLQLELGLLYYRLSAYKTAQSYFEAAVSGPNVPQSVINNVQPYLTAINKAARATQHTGLIRIGLGYQSNVNQGPRENTVSIGGIPFQLDAPSQASSDSNITVSGNYKATRRLARQGVSLVYGLSGSVSRQSDREDLDFASVEATAGPSFRLASTGDENATARIYATVSTTSLGGHRYSTYWGGGAEITIQPGVRSSSSMNLTYLDKSLKNSPAAPRARDREGDVFQLSTNWQFFLDHRRTFSATAEVTRNTARADYLSYRQYAVRAGHSWVLDTPSLIAPKAILGAALSAVRRNHDTADPFINPGIRQKDSEYVVQSSLTVPLPDRWSVLGELSYRRVNSNYSNREHDNSNITLSIIKAW